MREAYRLLIGSLGDDSHSIGMGLLRIAFQESGFFVRNLGILNVLDDFLYSAGRFDAVFISCMNGHVDLFLDRFYESFQLYKLGDNSPRAWYLGGNLSVKENSDEVIRKYRGMGFDYVAPKPVPWDEIVRNLLVHFHNKGIKPSPVLEDGGAEEYPPLALELVNDAPMSDAEFAKTRVEVLDSWPTGSQVWSANVPRNHSAPQKNLNQVIRARQSGRYRPLVQPRTGVAHTSDELEILRYLRPCGLEVSSVQLDAASRKKMFAKAQEGVARTERGRTSFLNGYPVPVHGVRGVEAIVEGIDTPFQIRAGSPDHRLVYEIALAGGASSVEGGFLCYLFPYDKFTSPVTSLSNWKYVDRLAANYHADYGVTINREYFGPLTTTLIEPSIPICINIVQAVLSARSGVRCISVGLAEQGNRSQDIAAIRVLDKATRQYLAKYGQENCTVSTVFHQYMGAFPTKVEKAGELIFESSVTGTLAGATRFLTKTLVESVHIPKKEDNARGLEVTLRGIEKGLQVKPDPEAVSREARLLEKEVTAIMNAVEALGAGSLARGAIRAFKEGILDILFSPSRYNRNQLLTGRDCDGAVRFFNPELLPFPADVIDFHRGKMSRRMQRERTGRVFDVIERDVTRIWKNDFARWPLDSTYAS